MMIEKLEITFYNKEKKKKSKCLKKIIRSFIIEIMIIRASLNKAKHVYIYTHKLRKELLNPMYNNITMMIYRCIK